MIFDHFTMISLAARDKGCPQALFDQLRGNGNGTSPPGKCNSSNDLGLKYFVSSRPITLGNTIYPTHTSQYIMYLTYIRIVYIYIYVAITIYSRHIHIHTYTQTYFLVIRIKLLSCVLYSIFLI